MAITFVPIQTVSLVSAQSSISFNSIPQTYTDLCLFISARSLTSGEFSDELIRFNNSTSNYTNRYYYGNGTIGTYGSNAYTGSGGFIAGMPGNGATTSTFGNKAVYIPNYASTSSVKFYILDGAAETNAITAYIHGLAGYWNDTSAITSIVLVTDNGVSYAANSTFTLYGIKNTI